MPVWGASGLQQQGVQSEVWSRRSCRVPLILSLTHVLAPSPTPTPPPLPLPQVATLVRACQVLSAAEFSHESCSTAGDDVYLCRYSWHDERRQFTRLTAGRLRGRGRGGGRGKEGEEGGMDDLFEEEESSAMEGCEGDSESDSDASFHAGGVESESEEEREDEDDVEEVEVREGESEDGYGSDGGSRAKRRGQKRKGRSRKTSATKRGSAPPRMRVR